MCSRVSFDFHIRASIKDRQERGSFPGQSHSVVVE